MSLIDELKRRNVFRVGVMYVVISWLILQVADVVLGNIEAPAWVFQVILLVLALGLPLALFFAWAFELTPDGLKREKDVDRNQSVTRQTGRKMDRAIIVVLALAVAYFAIDKYVFERDTSAPPDVAALDSPAQQPAEAADTTVDRSIAVLPFVNMSSDTEQEYFSDGISEELLNLLAKIPEFRVAGRTSSFAFKGKNEDLREIGSQLGVANILEGSVRKGGSRVRITAQLVKVDDGFHLWSDTYDRELTDVLKVQDEIAAAVVEQLKATLLDAADAAALGYEDDALSANAEAYDLYLRALDTIRDSRSPEDYHESAKLLEEAVSLVPTSALAWSNLGMAWSLYAGVATEGWTESLARARVAVNTALELDDSVPEAHVARARIATNFDWDWQLAEASLQRALELRPGDIRARQALARLRSTHGDLDTAAKMLREVIAQDPLNKSLQSSLAVQLILSGDLQESETIYRRLLRDSDSNATFLGMLSWNLALQGRTEDALRMAEQESVPFLRNTALAIIQQLLGNTDAAELAQQRLLEEYGNAAAYQQAIIFASWEQPDEALRWLQVAYDEGDPGLPVMKNDPTLIPLRDHPAYIEILEKMNLAD